MSGKIERARGGRRVLPDRQPAGRVLHGHVRRQTGARFPTSPIGRGHPGQAGLTPSPRAEPRCSTPFTSASARCARRSIEKKALLIISDGGDNHSRYTEGEIKSMVKEADVLIYAIGIYDHYFPTAEERMGPQLLSEVTELLVAAHLPSTIPTIWPMWLQKLVSSYATNMCSDTVQTIQLTTANGVR